MYFSINNQLTTINCTICISAKWCRHPLSRSYGARLPSSLTRFHSRALAHLCPPTCVGLRYGQPWEHPEVFLGSCFNRSASAEASTSLPSTFKRLANPHSLQNHLNVLGRPPLSIGDPFPQKRHFRA